jgi:hypothetical protein
MPALHHDGRSPTKRDGGPVKLNARMVRMISLMIDGHPDDPSHTPYGLYDAAESVGYRRRAARELAKSLVFIEAHNDAVAAAVANQPAPNPCPSLETVRVEEAWRAKCSRILQRQIEAERRARQLKAELDELRARHPEPVAFVPVGNPGYVIWTGRSGD